MGNHSYLIGFLRSLPKLENKNESGDFANRCFTFAAKFVCPAVLVSSKQLNRAIPCGIG
jgi:hypothetical protein